ncbi:WD repeat-containing protein 33 [Conglomerata obtusa]
MQNSPQEHDRPNNFIYDGRRMRVFMERRTTDYSSSIIHTRFNPSHLQPPVSVHMPCKLFHVSVNKFKCTVNTIKWTPDGRRLISGTSTGEFTLWNGYSFNFETILQAHESPVRSMCWSPTGSFLVSGDTLGILKYWHPSMSNIQVISGHAEAVRDISFAPFDGKFASCSDDGFVKVWDSKEAREECVLRGHGWDVRCAQWHRTKALIASGGKDNAIKLWDPRGKELTTLHLHKNTIFCLKWSNDGNYLFSGGKDQTVKMTDIRNMQTFTFKTFGRDITSLGVHPHYDELIVSGSANGSLQFYKTFCEEPIKTVEKAHENIIWGAEFHPVGHVLATGSLDQSCRFWIPDDGEEEEINANESESLENKDSDFIPGL